MAKLKSSNLETAVADYEAIRVKSEDVSRQAHTLEKQLEEKGQLVSKLLGEETGIVPGDLMTDDMSVTYRVSEIRTPYISRRGKLKTIPGMRADVQVMGVALSKAGLPVHNDRKYIIHKPKKVVRDEG